jgi:hypothetical protein
MRWTEHVSDTGEKMNAYGLLVGKPEGKKSVGRPIRRWKDDIKMILEV